MTGGAGRDEHAALVELLEVLSIESFTSYVWLGQRFEIRGDSGGARAVLAEALAARLYADFYCSGGPAPPEPAPDPSAPAWAWSRLDAMSAANAGRGFAQPGWVVRSIEDGLTVVERDGLRLWARASEVVTGAGGGEPGAQVELLLPKDSLGLSPGFYTAHGDAGDGPAADEAPVDRFYWNVRPEARPSLVRALTTRLNRDELQFRLKVLQGPPVERSDAGVLYTAPAERAEVRAALGVVRREVAGGLRPRTPALALALAPGLGFAEDPPGEESFGTHRCRLIAEALAEAHAQSLRGREERLAAIAGRFAAEGLSLDAPHLSAGSDARAAPAPIAT